MYSHLSNDTSNRPLATWTWRFTCRANRIVLYTALKLECLFKVAEDHSRLLTCFTISRARPPGMSRRYLQCSIACSLLICSEAWGPIFLLELSWTLETETVLKVLKTAANRRRIVERQCAMMDWSAVTALAHHLSLGDTWPMHVSCRIAARYLWETTKMASRCRAPSSCNIINCHETCKKYKGIQLMLGAIMLWKTPQVARV